MQHKITTYWRVFWQWRKLETSRMVQYRNNFWFWSFVSLMWTCFNFFFFDVISRVSGGIGGWSPLEMRMLIAVFSILDAFTWSWFFPNMRAYTNAIFTGEFSSWLLKPIDAQFIAMNSVNSYTNFLRFGVGVGVLITTMQRLNLQVTPWNLLVFLFFLAVAMVFIYSWWFMLSTIAFWVEKLDNVNEILPAFRTIWQLPRTVYTGAISTLFTVILPFGLVTSLPTEVLLGKQVTWWLVYFVIATAGTVVAARVFFKYSLRRYSGIAQ
jgi:ABC-2 type transport system permease protein